jgi:hypothetical protein
MGDDTTLTGDPLDLLASERLARHVEEQPRARLEAHRERLRREERAKGPDKGKGGRL